MALCDDGSLIGEKPVRAARGIGALPLVPIIVLTACSDPVPPAPREAAIAACEQAAIAQYDLEAAGRADVRELSIDEGEAFEVIGAAEGTEWVCTWTYTSTEGGTTSQTTIDTR